MHRVASDGCEFEQNHAQATRKDRARISSRKKEGRESEAPTATARALAFLSFFLFFFEIDRALFKKKTRTCCRPLRPATPRADMASLTERGERIEGKREEKGKLNALSLVSKGKKRKKVKERRKRDTVIFFL